jgi:hypothetical protein
LSEPRTQRSGVSGRSVPPLTPLRCVRGSDCRFLGQGNPFSKLLRFPLEISGVIFIIPLDQKGRVVNLLLSLVRV